MRKVAILIVGVCGLAGAQIAWAQPAARPLTEPQARFRAMDWGCSNLSRLSMGQTGRWFGQCQKGGDTVSIVIDEAGKVSQRTPTQVTAAAARADLMAYGCNDVSALSREPGGLWHGRCEKGGRTVDVAVDPQGNVSSAQL